MARAAGAGQDWATEHMKCCRFGPGGAKSSNDPSLEGGRACFFWLVRSWGHAFHSFYFPPLFFLSFSGTWRQRRHYGRLVDYYFTAVWYLMGQKISFCQLNFSDHYVTYHSALCAISERAYILNECSLPKLLVSSSPSSWCCKTEIQSYNYCRTTYQSMYLSITDRFKYQYFCVSIIPYDRRRLWRPLNIHKVVAKRRQEPHTLSLTSIRDGTLYVLCDMIAVFCTFEYLLGYLCPSLK